MRKVVFSLSSLLFFLLVGVLSPVHAGEVLGIHILHPYEVEDTELLLKTDANRDSWSYVTIPFTLSDISKKNEWQTFFNKCKEKKLIPIVRLATRIEGDSWSVPTRKEVVELSKALSALDWPSEERIVIVFNEPNHAKEWGNTIDPEGYARLFEFTSSWFRTEQKGYVVLPAAMDLAAPNGSSTMEAFTYWRKAISVAPEIFEYMDGWNSHSYPNPGFSSSPYRNTKDSLRGFQHELAFVKQYSERELPVYITETGWVENKITFPRLAQYYDYAQKNIWSDPRVKAVTPFLLRGASGPFSSFSFFDEYGNRTRQFEAYRRIVERQM